MQLSKVQEWCPNCEFFRKDNGMNNCTLVSWALNPNGGRSDVRHWLSMNADSATNIDESADNCPGFLPYPKLAQLLYVKSRG